MGLRERGLDRRIFGEQRRAPVAELGLDKRGQHLGEDVGPGVVGARRHACRLRHRREPVAILAAREAALRRAREQVDAGVAAERLCDREPFGLGARIARHAAERDEAVVDGFRSELQERGGVRHHRLVGCVRAVPLQKRELGRVQAPALAIAEGVREREDPLLARRQQLLSCELGRGVEIERLARKIGM